MKTTATAAMETFLAVPPLDLIVQATADRLAQRGIWTPNFRAGHGKICNVISNPIFGMPRDRMTHVTDFTRRFDAIVPSRQDWLDGWPADLPGNCMVRFTDGSRALEGAGAGVYNPGAVRGN